VFVASGTQHAMSMRRIVICGLSGCAEFFSKLSHKRDDFRKNDIEHKMRVLISSANFV
jgi:hypothetical protein